MPRVLDQVAVQHWSVGSQLFLFRDFILTQVHAMVSLSAKAFECTKLRK